MPSNTDESTERILLSAKLAVSALGEISLSSGMPFLATAVSISLCILTGIQTLKSNRQELMQMVGDIQDILCGIITLHAASAPENILPPAVLHDIGYFTETLDKIKIWLGNQRRTSKIRRLLRLNEEAAQLEACKARLNQARDVFGIHSRMSVSTGLEALQQDAQIKHDEIFELLDAELASTDTDSSYSTSRSLSSLGGSSGTLFLLPTSPKIFHGRESELRDVINILRRDSPRMAILGTGGIGKTSLATAALHHPEIMSRFTNRYFISCDSAVTSSDLVSIAASNLSLEPSRNLAKVVAHHLSSGPPSLLVFDNFETPWEPVDGRAEVENFLSLLADVPHVALLITMRGAERPGKVQWTRPFLPPLMPLTHTAARQTFIDIADETHDESEMDELLRLTDNLPLAVSLVANVACSEGCATALARWKYESTALLSDGYDKRSNLEISIMLSLSSPRILSSPDAQDLLSLMSLLSDGISDTDLLQSKLPIPDIRKCKTALVRTSLAYLDHAGRLRVLAPIREYVRGAQPPSPVLVRPLRRHYKELLELWTKFMHRAAVVVDLVPRLLANLGNLHNVLLHGLDCDRVDLAATIGSIISLSSLNRVMERGFTPLLLRLPEMLDQMDDHELHGRFITETFDVWQFYPITDPSKSIDEAIGHFRINNDVQKEARFYNVIAAYNMDRVGDLEKGQKFFGHALSLATQSGDTVSQIRALGGLSAVEWFLGNYDDGLRLGGETQRMADANGDMKGQSEGLRWQAMCCTALGDFKRSAQFLAEGRELLVAAGLQGGEWEHMFMNAAADLHQLKTEYAEALAIQVVIARETSPVLSPVTHAYALVNIAFLDLVTGASTDAVSANLNAATATFRSGRYPRGLSVCALYRADLLLREGDAARARAEYLRLFAALRGVDDELACCCLAKLADPTHAHALHSDAEATRWAVVFAAFTMRSAARNTLAVHQALRCLGEVLARQEAKAGGEALSVLEVALEGFTLMDVHQSRGACMRTIGDVHLRRGEAGRAEELWTAARPLFVRSQQMDDVAGIDERLHELGMSSSGSHCLPL
ncbi:hypothetical protein C8R44DRAFT_856537 [Mycena epipterygia]|nr:hypothetical protein C8R44DRAFT_856537 [Mycena epipterygia]